MLVLLNPSAAGGKAGSRWTRVAPLLEERFGSFALRAPRGSPALRETVAEALARGERRFVAAGGDGTVNRILAVLTETGLGREGDGAVLGALGLGSSNDFHKPRRAGATLGGFPSRLDFDQIELMDVGVLEYIAKGGARRVRPWLLSASVGATAEGAFRYNAQVGPCCRALKRVSVTASLASAALRAVSHNRPREWRLRVDDDTALVVRLCNLAVVKNPHFGGVLRYDSPLEPGGGRFFVHGLGDVPRHVLFRTLANLARGRFAEGAGTWSRPARVVEIDAPAPFPVELDGEVVQARSARFSVGPERLSVAT